MAFAYSCVCVLYVCECVFCVCVCVLSKQHKVCVQIADSFIIHDPLAKLFKIICWQEFIGIYWNL